MQTEPQKSAYAFDFFAPIAAKPDAKRRFIALVKHGGEVNADTLPDLVDRAVILAFAWHGQELAAVGGLKRPNAAYRARIFDKAGVRDPAAYKFELGWVYVSVTSRPY